MQVAERHEDPEAHAHPDQGGEDRQAHGHHRPEGEEHDHDGGQEPDHLARPRCGRDDLLDRCAPDRHLQTWTGEAARGVDHPPDGARRQVRGRSVELDHHEADPAVGRQLPAGARGERTLHARDVCQGLQGPHQPADGRGVGGAVERTRRAQDHVRAVALLGREPARQEVLGLLRGRAAQGEVVVQPAPGPLREPDDGHHGEEPAEQHPAPVVVAPRGEPTEPALRRSGNVRAGRALRAHHLHASVCNTLNSRVALSIRE